MPYWTLLFKIILPSVLYGLVVWGGCPNADLSLYLEVLHRRAARIICNLPRDMPTDEVYRYSNWNTLTFCSKHRLLKLLIACLWVRHLRLFHTRQTNFVLCTTFRRSNIIIVPRFNSQFLKNSVSYRGAILWNVVSCRRHMHYRDFKCFSLFFCFKCRSHFT